MSDLRIATRRSWLAIAQAELVAAALRSANPGLEVSLVEVSTTGDLDRASPVTTLTEVGAFVRAVQHTLLDGTADLAVHACKDLPVWGPEELVAFYPEREAPWDVLCGHTLDTLPSGARVGTGSPRRTAQLARVRPDLVIEDIRGNVDTRLDKVASGDFDAVVLAEAGLRRLGREDEIGHRFSLEEMVPAPAQGALAVEAVVGGPPAAVARAVDHPPTRRAVEAERAVLARTGAGCRAALGVHGALDGDEIRLTGFVEDERGPRFGVAVSVTPDEAARELQEVLGL
jgi:hydroxymethylbilane synthase